MSVAIITGASGGIGSEFARQLNKMLGIDEFWFIARREDRMLKLRDELGVNAKVISADLTTSEGIDKVRDALVKEKPAVMNDEDVKKSLAVVEEKINGNGRVLLRESGTEPVIRVMVEAETMALCQEYAGQIAEKIRERGHCGE